MTMNKNMLGLVFGAMLLAGCADEVMQQRKYVPADDPAVGDKAPVTEVAADPAGNRQVTVEERTADDSAKPQPAPEESKNAPRQTSEFKPMTEKFDDSGVSSDESEVAAAPGEYIVRPGDTLGKIAARHHVRLAALMKANNLTEKNAKRLRVGQKLVIPGGRGGKNAPKGCIRPSASDKKAPAAGKATDGGKASIQPGEYIVKAGDTPERIARRAHVRLSELMAANKMTEADAKRLRIGQKLVIPGKGGKSIAKASKPAVKKQNKEKTAVANSASTTAAEVPAAKPGEPAKKDDAAILDEMQNTPTEQAPTGQTAAPGAAAQPAGTAAADAAKETPWVDVTEDIPLADFAKKYNTTPEALRAANPDGIGDVIKKGDTIFLPR